MTELDALRACADVLRALMTDLDAAGFAVDGDDPDGDGLPGTEAVEILCDHERAIRAALARIEAE